jgi:ATP-dependent Clp protease ATP-binding subunit ClpB
MSEIQYGTLPELEKQLAAAQEVEHKGFTLLQDKVTARKSPRWSRAGPAFR